MTTADSIRPVLGRALEPTSLVLDDVTVTPDGRRRVVKVLVDRDVDDSGTTSDPTPPLTLDEVADATRLVSDALDATDVMGEQPYTLEVSSPGVGRPLTTSRHYRRNVGRLVTVRRADGDVTGRIVSATAHEVTLEVPSSRSTPASTTTLPYAGVERAVVEVEFARPDESKES